MKLFMFTVIALWMIARFALRFRPDQPMSWKDVCIGELVAVGCLWLIWFVYL